MSTPAIAGPPSWPSWLAVALSAAAAGILAAPTSAGVIAVEAGEARPEHRPMANVITYSGHNAGCGIRLLAISTAARNACGS